MTRSLAALTGVVLALGCSSSAGPTRSSRPDAPAPLAAPARAVDVAAGTLHSCALMADGRVQCWGANDHGQLGGVAADTCSVPDLLHGGPPLKLPCTEAPVIANGITDAVRLVAAGDTTCALSRSGGVRCWGENASGASGLSKALDVAIGPTHACALLPRGEVACWGGNFFGQLGVPPDDPGRAAIAKGGYAAVRKSSPVRVPGLDAVEQIAVGEHLTCVRRRNQDVLCFGRFAPGMQASSTPAPVPELRAARVLALGHASHATLDVAGAMRGWGANSHRQLLDGTREPRKSPVAASGLPALSALAWSATRGCAVARSGEALCWGDSGRNAVDPPTRVKLPGKVTRIALGASHACALGADGSVWCWGDGFYGATGTRKGSQLPTSAFWTPPHRVL
jgi:alpha-tubulin suppressor-like RCC1 family protein